MAMRFYESSRLTVKIGKATLHQLQGQTMQTLPDNCISYKKTPVFDQDSIPAGLLRAHQTKAGAWGKIVVLEGKLLYRILEPTVEEHILDKHSHGVVEPQVLHEVSPQGEVKFYVDFHREVSS